MDSLAKEKAAYTCRDYTQTYADGRATNWATTVDAQLVKAIDDLAHYTIEAGCTNLTPAELNRPARPHYCHLSPRQPAAEQRNYQRRYRLHGRPVQLGS